MDEVESWRRNCEWKTVPELDVPPLMPMICRIGISANMPQPGDAVCMMLGSSMPYILRDNGDFHELIGCGKLYLISRYMWKAVVKAYQAGNIGLREFVIR